MLGAKSGMILSRRVGWASIPYTGLSICGGRKRGVGAHGRAPLLTPEQRHPMMNLLPCIAMKVPHIRDRRSIRLPGYDYSQPGWYFVTICT